MVLVLGEMQTASSKIQTRITVSIFNDDTTYNTITDIYQILKYLD